MLSLLGDQRTRGSKGTPLTTSQTGRYKSKVCVRTGSLVPLESACTCTPFVGPSAIRPTFNLYIPSDLSAAPLGI